MDRGYQHNLKTKLLSEINETQRNWKSALLKRVVQYSQIDSNGVSRDKKGLHWYQWYDWYQ